MATVKVTTLLLILGIALLVYVISKQNLPKIKSTAPSIVPVLGNAKTEGLGLGRWIKSLFDGDDNTAYDSTPDKRMPSNVEMLS